MLNRIRYDYLGILTVFLVALCGVVALFVNSFIVAHIDEGSADNVQGVEKRFTLSGSLPMQATNILFCRASVGPAGRLLIYRFSAPADELHRHAELEFASHWAGLKVIQTPASSSPITSERIRFIRDAYSADATWLLPPANASGTIYRSAHGGGGSHPLIYVDEINATLYFDMSD